MKRFYKVSKVAAKAYSAELDNIAAFCNENDIVFSGTMDSYYFTLNNKKYRVSNHSVESSRKNSKGLYHTDGRKDDTIYIHAGKTRIIGIYTLLKQGKKLDGHGNIIE
jgi:hypothetical protein